MPTKEFIPQRTVDWSPVRSAYVERANRATYAELAEEFCLSPATVGRCAAEEGWPSLRASYLARKVQEGDASSVILAAVQVDRSVVRSVANFALVTIARCTAAVESVDESRAPATKLDAYNTATFAVRNICAALRDAGIVGLPKGLSAEGKEDNGRWNPQMLQQINLQVTAIAQQAAQASAPMPASVVATPSAEKPDVPEIRGADE